MRHCPEHVDEFVFILRRHVDDAGHTTEIGDISEIVHIWAYDSLDDRIKRRDRMAADSRWQEFGRKVKALDILLKMESRIMRPTDFSPLK